MGAKILGILGVQILNRGQGAVTEQRNPVIIRAHMHAPLLGLEHGRRLYRTEIVNIVVTKIGLTA